MKEVVYLEELYFAYGSNLNLGQMAVRCPQAEVVGKAVLEGYELAFRRGVLTVLPKEGSRVDGLLWRVNDRDEQELDRYEGYPNLYRKEALTVQTEHGPLSVIAYAMNAPYCEIEAVPTNAYMNTVLHGCQQNDIAPDAIFMAAAKAWKGQSARRKRLDRDR